MMQINEEEITDILEEIIESNDGTYLNDRGNGATGPQYLDADDLESNYLNCHFDSLIRWGDAPEEDRQLILDAIEAYDGEAEPDEFDYIAYQRDEESGYETLIWLWKI